MSYLKVCKEIPRPLSPPNRNNSPVCMEEVVRRVFLTCPWNLSKNEISIPSPGLIPDVDVAGYSAVGGNLCRINMGKS